MRKLSIPTGILLALSGCQNPALRVPAGEDDALYRVTASPLLVDLPPEEPVPELHASGGSLNIADAELFSLSFRDTLPAPGDREHRRAGRRHRDHRSRRRRPGGRGLRRHPARRRPLDAHEAARPGAAPRAGQRVLHRARRRPDPGHRVHPARQRTGGRGEHQPAVAGGRGLQGHRRRGPQPGVPGRAPVRRGRRTALPAPRGQPQGPGAARGAHLRGQLTRTASTSAAGTTPAGRSTATPWTSSRPSARAAPST